MTDTPFKYTWRNNVRFDPHGLQLTLASGGWQGWIETSGTADLGGAIQFRSVNDQVYGGGSTAYVFGLTEVTFDVSFRVRA